MKNIFLIIALLFIIKAIHAQAPGYMGKKFALYYEPAFFAGLNGAKWSSFTVNLRHDISMDYTISRSLALGASFKYLATKLEDVSIQKEVVIEDNFSLYTYIERFSGDVRLKSNFFSIYLKSFPFNKFGSISPVGKYRKYEIVFYVTTYETHDAHPVPYFYNVDKTINDVEELGYEVKNPSVALIYSFGNQLLYYDKVFVNIGGQMGVAIPDITNALNRFGSSQVLNETDFQNLVAGRVAGALFFNFHVGMGLLAF
jgi:hypothetical protein